jgi:hypothetical protein
MTIEPIIARFIGQAEAAGPDPLAAHDAASAQRLRTIVGGEVGEGAGPDHGPAADALQLAAYLDGAMSAAERDAFEATLTHSPAHRDALIAAADWIDTVAARRELPPAELTALALALESPPASAPRSRNAGLVGWIERLLPRPRLAIATSALASIAIVAVGFDIAMHMNPSVQRTIQPPTLQSLPASEPSGVRADMMREPLPRSLEVAMPSGQARQPIVPPGGDPIILNAETINALIAYRDAPSPARQAELLAALARSGAPAIPTERVRTITLQSPLYERLTQRSDALPTRISARLMMDGALAIAIGD